MHCHRRIKRAALYLGEFERSSQLAVIHETYVWLLKQLHLDSHRIVHTDKKPLQNQLITNNLKFFFALFKQIYNGGYLSN